LFPNGQPVRDAITFYKFTKITLRSIETGFTAKSSSQYAKSKWVKILCEYQTCTACLCAQLASLKRYLGVKNRHIPLTGPVEIVSFRQLEFRCGNFDQITFVLMQADLAPRPPNAKQISYRISVYENISVRSGPAGQKASFKRLPLL